MKNFSILAIDIGYNISKYVFGSKLGEFHNVSRSGVYVNYENEANAKDCINKATTQLSNQSSKSFVENGIISIFRTISILGFVSPDLIVVSLPLDAYKQFGENFQELNIKITTNEQTFKYEIMVLYQNLGTWYEMNSPQNALIINIDYDAVDVLTILNSKPLKSCSFTINSSEIAMLIAKLKNHIKKQFNVAEESIAKYHIGKEIQLIKDYYITKIIEQAFSCVRANNIVIDNIIVSGVGAYFISKAIKDKYSITIPENPIFSNAVGFVNQANKNS